MIELYTARNSICTQKVFITLDEKALPYEMRVVNLFTNEQYLPEYLKINPKGVVPSLIRDGEIVVESTLICEYLDENFPERPLMPKSPHGRARSRLWSKLVDEHIFEATREISFSAHFRYKMRTMTEEQRQIRYANVGDPERRARFMSTFERGVESPYVFQAVAHFEKAFKQMEEALAGGSQWLVSEAYTLADINMVPYIARMEYLTLLDVWTADRPRVRDWWARAKARPSTVEAIPNRLTSDEIGEMREYGAAIHDDVARLRADYLRMFPSRH
ncbi:MAG: Glutathione S-transferase [Rhodospirillales bacterium]|nr:Glutathione S-transferase [Rhodospirillales bacterium]